MTSSQDDSLRQVIRQHWTVAAPVNPGFRTAVWARIEAGRRLPETWAGWLKLHIPQVAAGALASVVLAGVGGGVLAAHRPEDDREQLIRHYVASIDPHQQGGAVSTR